MQTASSVGVLVPISVIAGNAVVNAVSLECCTAAVTFCTFDNIPSYEVTITSMRSAGESWNSDDFCTCVLFPSLFVFS